MNKKIKITALATRLQIDVLVNKLGEYQFASGSWLSADHLRTTWQFFCKNYREANAFLAGYTRGFAYGYRKRRRDLEKTL